MTPIIVALVIAAGPRVGAPARKAKAPPPASPTPAVVAPVAPVAPPAEAPPPVVEKPAEPPRVQALRVAVLDPQAVGDVPPRPLAAFNQTLVPEIRKLQGVSPIGMGEIREMIAFDRQRQLLGCGEDSCLAEIAGALGVDEIVSTQLAAVGASYTLTMKRIDMKRAKVAQSESRTFEKRDGEELLAIVGPMVAALYPTKPLKEGRSRGVDKEAVKRLNPPPLPRWVFFATAGATAGALAGGGAFGYLALDTKRELDRRFAAADAVVTDFGEQQKRFESRKQTANVLFATSGALALAAAVEFFFTDWRNDRAALEVKPVAQADAQGVLLAGRF